MAMFLVAFYILPSFFNNVSFFTSLGAECVYLASYAFSFFLYDLMGDDDDGDGATGNGATGYDDYNDGDWQRRQ